MTNEERLDTLEILADAVQTARNEIGCRLTKSTGLALPLDTYRLLTQTMALLDALDTEVGQRVSDAAEATAAEAKLARMTPASQSLKKPVGSVSEDEASERLKDGS